MISHKLILCILRNTTPTKLKQEKEPEKKFVVTQKEVSYIQASHRLLLQLINLKLNINFTSSCQTFPSSLPATVHRRSNDTLLVTLRSLTFLLFCPFCSLSIFYDPIYEQMAFIRLKEAIYNKWRGFTKSNLEHLYEQNLWKKVFWSLQSELCYPR